MVERRLLEVAVECNRLISTFRIEALRNVEMRWQILMKELQQREPYSLLRLEIALHRAGLYIEGLRRITSNWIRLKFRSPLPLHPISHFRRYRQLDIEL